MEYKFIEDIRKHIASSEVGWVEVPMNVFLKIWGISPRTYDKRMTENLLRFTKENNLGHVSVVRDNKVIAVRFWNIEAEELLEEGN